MKKFLFLIVFAGLSFFIIKCGTQSSDSFTTKKYDRKYATGLKRDWDKHPNFVNKYAVKQGRMKAAAVPGSFDMSAIVSPPEDQGNCGSCWDFSLTKALRSAWMIAGKDPKTLAFNYLLNNCGKGPRQFGCGGGDFDAGESFLDKGGPWLESQDPYREREGSCKNLPTVASAISFKSVGTGNGAPSFQQLAEALSQKHMLSVDVAVCGSWENYSGGIYTRNECGVGSINHMVNLVGYNCQTSVDAVGNCKFDSKGEPVNKDGYLIVMNNWGNNWGENGYMRSKAHVNALAYTAMYFEVDAPVVPQEPVVFTLKNKAYTVTVTLDVGNPHTKEEAMSIVQQYLDTLE